MDPTYEIIDGVRRSKAASMAGHRTIRARLYTRGGQKLVREFEAAIEQLRSPHKSRIRCISRADLMRWQRIVQGAKLNPLPFPPIEVVEGSRGAKVEDILLDFGQSP